MPELPEVEVSRMGISPHITGQTIKKLVVRQRQLRWPVPEKLEQLQGVVIEAVERRAKYLLLRTEQGSIVVHLGMSGSLRIQDSSLEPTKHDHVDLVLENGKMLRYNDPRRFGSWQWVGNDESLALLDNLGPEPLSDEFCTEHIIPLAAKRRVAVKQFIMDNKVVVGVGNIYANESLFNARIHPLRPANSLTYDEWELLVDEIKQVLANAIKQGGTTLNDFEQPDGKPGYFAQQLQVYGRAGEACPVCKTEISQKMVGQRNTFWCESCQQQIEE
ncbi:bifunctional DNA-formamidopyrimidine glycosylase/DNA-(apurinic or apyrimidinic site) lyase [Vibrio breoganii]|uniref:bifunctional DNA-formamidopyrimidine glycosylase/DNA-(apurinic or apyrimidinic site) lyase n=1 Tax=Vibrio breoganii TaxID=553239 RepID=UPI000C81F82E|nr:bifunctional DNA-formamidopyrimidine glycosylase/DNA-(apurinic or apyrimidinic site) lyase [Vibrio breoganii]PML60361.1 DNA-formamidopyrimidine glycosylase [Vibrio breoganii]PMO63114.1 DNA-formamidopyrimidine glycosylase [Vibrio breoganii]PMO82035.1 DNA-formamidopyrimidine glycosylase [Vibrio breoganii]